MKIIILIATLISYTSFAHENAERIKKDIAESGYATFADTSQGIFSDDELNEIRTIFSSLSKPDCYPITDAHYLSYTSQGEFTFDIDASGLITDKYISLWPIEQASYWQEERILEAAKKILAVFPIDKKTHNSVTIQLNYFSDLRTEIERSGAELFDNKIIAQSPIKFHQDKFYKNNYNFLFFQVLDTKGFVEHNSELAFATVNKLTRRAKTNAATMYLDNVLPITNVTCVKGSGYAINQDYQDDFGNVIVHRHDGFLTNLSKADSNPAKSDFPEWLSEAARRSFSRQAKHIIDENILEKVFRDVFVVRIKTTERGHEVVADDEESSCPSCLWDWYQAFYNLGVRKYP